LRDWYIPGAVQAGSLRPKIGDVLFGTRRSGLQWLRGPLRPGVALVAFRSLRSGRTDVSGHPLKALKTGIAFIALVALRSLRSGRADGQLRQQCDAQSGGPRTMS
jgi:hypothetical protein